MENKKYAENDDGTFGDKENKLLLYRHATSNVNIKYRECILAEVSTDEVNFTEVERDSELADIGIELAISKQHIFDNLNIHTVFVSPMKRTLQTAYYTFKTHPNFDKIKFIILPKAREWLNFAAGIPKNIDSVISHFKELLPNLDSSELDKYKDRLHYFIEDTDQNIYEEIMEAKQYKESDPIKSNVFDLIVEKAKKLKPKELESKRSILKRVNAVKSYISDYLQTLEHDEKVVLVTHYYFLELWTGEWNSSLFEEDNTDVRNPDNFFNFDNCSILYSPISTSLISQK